MTQWFLETLLSITLVMLLVLALRAPVGRLFGAHWAYALWLAPLFRLIMPPLSLPGENSSYTLVPEMLGAAAHASAAPSISPALPTTMWFLIWGVGATALFLWQLLSHHKLVTAIRSTSQAAEPSSYGGVSVIKSQGTRGALAVGLWAPRIVVPADFSQRYSEAEQRLVLEHELVHHRRGDIWWNWLALLVLAANWFNPIAYLAFRAFRADQELSCDAAVTASLSPPQRYDYAQALVKSATRNTLLAACSLNHVAQLKQRLNMLKSHPDKAKRRVTGLFAVIAVITGGIAITPSNGMGGEELVARGGGSPLTPAGASEDGTLSKPCSRGRGAVGPEVDAGNGKLRRSVDCLIEGGRAIDDGDVMAAEARGEIPPKVNRRQVRGPDKVFVSQMKKQR
jgi:beta-lactamase regulating signal transducer with metallopeptidase domain